MKHKNTRLTRIPHKTHLTYPSVPLSPNIITQALETPHGRAAYTIVETLLDAGYEAWWVGGCVRDMWLGKLPYEIDIATNAPPHEVQKLFPKNKDIGKAFGSIIVQLQRVNIEVTTFREDDEVSDGRHPESVVFGTREKDAARRDLTINALYWNPISSELYDPFNGEADLKEKLINFIGDPAIRIKHDALRMLRAVRFRATLDGQYHPDTYRALQELASMSEVLSASRQLQELEKMLLCPNPARALEDLWELGILKYILPELYACKGIAQPKDYHHEGDVWEHSLQCVRSFKDEQGIDVRIAALFHDCGKAETFSLKERIRFDHHATVSAQLTAKAMTRLQMPRKRIEKLSWLIDHHMMMGSFADMNDERKAHWYFHPWFPELLQIFWLDIAGTTPSEFKLYDAIVTDYNRFLNSHPKPPKALLSGNDIIELLGIKPGAKVGELMQKLLDAQIRKEVTTKQEAKDFLVKKTS